MEQSRISSQNPAPSTHASTRLKKTDKSSSDAAANSPAGSFDALMAALGGSLAADDTADLAAPDPVIADANTSGQLVDPLGLAGGQAMLGIAVTPNGLDPALSKGAINAATSNTSPDAVNLTWAQSPTDGGLVAQTLALDGLGDRKDGDVAAGVLNQGRPLRATTTMGQRGESLASLAGLPAKGLVGEFAKGVASQGLDAVAVTASAPTVGGRDVALPQSAPARESMGGGDGASRLGAGVQADVAFSDGVSPVLRGAGANEVSRDSLGAQGSPEGAWVGSVSDAPSGVPDLGADAMPVFGDPDEALAQQVTYWVNQKTQNAEVTLSHDGRPVEVSVSLSGKEAHVSFRSDQEHMRQLLDGHMAQLGDMLRDQGLMLSGSSVGTSGQHGRGSANGGDVDPEDAAPRRQATVAVVNDRASADSTSSSGKRSLDIFV